MANNIIQFLFTAKDEASAKVKDLAKTMRGEGAGGLTDMDKATQAATRSTSKFAQVIKTLMTGNVAEAGRNLAEMGGKFAGIAAAGAVAVTGIMAWGKAIKAIMAYRFESALYGIQSALNALNGSVEASAKLFARQEASLNRVTASAIAYAAAQAEIRATQNTIAATQVSTIRTQMQAGVHDPVRMAKINAAADAELARIRIANERAVLAEREKAHEAEKRAIERENALLQEQSKKRLQLASEAADQANKIAEKIDSTITLGGRINEEQNNKLLAEQDKALSTQKQLLAENEADTKKRLDNQSKLDQMENNKQVFAAQKKLVDEMDANERAIQEKRMADIAEMERKKAEEAAKEKQKIEKEIELATVENQIAQVENNMAETERGFGVAAREKVLEEAKVLEEEGNRKFGKKEWEQRLDDNKAAKERAKDERDMENRIEFARQMRDRVGGSYEGLPENMKELIDMDNERKGAAGKAGEKREQADAMRREEVRRQQVDAIILEGLEMKRFLIQVEIKDLLQKNLQIQQ